MAEGTKVYVVQGEYEGGVWGLFTKEESADAFKAACDDVSSDDSTVKGIDVDVPWQCDPVVGYDVHQMEGGPVREAFREIMGRRADWATPQEFGDARGKIYAHACRPTEAEARAVVAELIAAKRAEADARKE